MNVTSIHRYTLLEGLVTQTARRSNQRVKIIARQKTFQWTGVSYRVKYDRELNHMDGTSIRLNINILIC